MRSRVRPPGSAEGPPRPPTLTACIHFLSCVSVSGAAGSAWLPVAAHQSVNSAQSCRYVCTVRGEAVARVHPPRIAARTLVRHPEWTVAASTGSSTGPAAGATSRAVLGDAATRAGRSDDLNREAVWLAGGRLGDPLT